jgi:hypothetical protein
MTAVRREKAREAALIEEYQAWCRAQGLPDMSADELVLEDEIMTAEQRAWLMDFIHRWKAAAER